ncbi:cyclic nucleotide-binding domain containing protein, partial [Reticulomyxa filosa]
KDFESKTTVLINIPAFKHLTRKTLEKLTFYMKEIKLCKDSILFKEGDQTDGLYLIKDGEFEITKRYKRSLKEKHKTQAFPIKIKKEIRCCTLSKNEALGLDFIIGRRSYRQYYNKITEKFTEMTNIQDEFFKNRLEANLKILGVEADIMEEEVIKSNNKDK